MAHIFSIRIPEIVAAVFLFILPPLVFATAAQKFLVKGLSSGAVKG
jgi:ABC-type glycerol-3-phosphate transport system permease component